jgi:hypothetical protein
MAVKLVSSEHYQPKWFPLELADGEAIEIALNRPNLEVQLQTLQDLRGGSYQAYQLGSTIADWRGVVDEAGEPVPYSWPSLNQLCQAYDDVAIQLIRLCRKSLAGPSETERKNSPPPSVAGGGDTSDEAANSTRSSMSTSNSNASNDSAVPSE